MSGPRPFESAGEILRTWRRLASWPAGSWLFSRFLGFLVPYTGSIHPRVRALEPGYARVELRDRRAIRNHLSSIHAVALVNLGEVTSGLALMAALPSGVRGIVTQLRVDYLKKARGRLIAECRATAPAAAVRGQVDHTVEALINDASGDPVARVTVHWRLGPAAPAA